MSLKLDSSKILQKGLAALRAGQLREAESSFKSVLHAEPRHVAALNFVAIALMRQGKFAEAETYLQLALQQQPHSDATLSNYGLVLKALNRPAQALERFTQALDITPAAETYNGRGTVLRDLGRVEESLADFSKAITLNSRYVEAYLNKGNCLATLGRFEDAVSAFETALTLKPDFADAWFGCGDAYRSLNRYEDALHAYDHVVELVPDSLVAHVNRAVALFYLKRYSEALESCNRAISLDANHIEAWIARSKILAEWKWLSDATSAHRHLSNPIPFLVLHYPPANARRTYIEREWCKQAGRMHFDIQFITRHNKEEPHVRSSYTYDESMCRSMIGVIKDTQIGYFLSLCLDLSAPFIIEKHKLKNTSLDQDIIAYPHLAPGPLSLGDISLICKHREAWMRIANDASDYAVIAEDDIIFDPHSLSYLLDLIENLPGDAEYVDIAGGSGFRPRSGNKCVNNHFFEIRPPKTRTTCGAILSRSFAQRVIDLNPPVYIPIDWMFDWIFAQLDTKVYWVQPVVFDHGSQMGLYTSLFPRPVHRRPDAQSALLTLLG